MPLISPSAAARSEDTSWPHLAVDVEGQLLRAGYQQLPLILVMTT